MNKIQSNTVLNEVSEAQAKKSDSLLRRSYQAPSLITYGDVRDVTLGTTGGIGESGNEGARRMP